MSKLNWGSIKNGISKRSPQILTAVAVLEFAATVYLAVKVTPKAEKMIHEAEAEKGASLTPVETVKAAWKCYIPTAIAGACTVTSMIGANSIALKRNAMLTAACQLTETAFREYKDKVVETIGEKKEAVIQDAIAQDYMNRVPINEAQIIRHGDLSEEEGVIFTGEEISLYHAEEPAAKNQNDEGDSKMADEKKEPEQNEKTVEDVFNTLNEEQKTVVYALIGQAIEDATAKHSDTNNEEGDDTMKHNVFEQDETQNTTVLSHSDMKQILSDAKRGGSLREAYNAYTDNGELVHSIDTTGMETATGNQTYGFNDASMLFPEPKSLNNPPEWIKREMGWVQKVMNSVHRTPFSRIKSMFADLTEDEARAKGYLKAHEKKEQVFTTLKRSTTPQTIYKKQKLDRDDVIDITDFDVVAWIRGEMRVMLDEEIARAILIGDGRPGDSEDKIDPQHIRPIAEDVPLFNTKVMVVLNGVFKEAIFLREASYNPCLGVTVSKAEPFHGSAYEAIDAQRLLSVIVGDDIEPAVYLGLYLGLRRSEVAGLRWKDVDFDRNLVHICNTVTKFRSVTEQEMTKTRASKRDLYLPSGLKLYLLKLRKKQLENKLFLGAGYTDGTHVCQWADGRAYRPDYITMRFRKILERYDLPRIRFHDLRHTAGSLLVNEGHSIKQVQEFLGHEKASTTLDIYTHLSTESKRDTAEKLDQILAG